MNGIPRLYTDYPLHRSRTTSTYIEIARLANYLEAGTVHSSPLCTALSTPPSIEQKRSHHQGTAPLRSGRSKLAVVPTRLSARRRTKQRHRRSDARSSPRLRAPICQPPPFSHSDKPPRARCASTPTLSLTRRHVREGFAPATLSPQCGASPTAMPCGRRRPCLSLSVSCLPHLPPWVLVYRPQCRVRLCFPASDQPRRCAWQHGAACYYYGRCNKVVAAKRPSSHARTFELPPAPRDALCHRTRPYAALGTSGTWLSSP